MEKPLEPVENENQLGHEARDQSPGGALVLAPAKARALTAREFQGLAEVPPAVEWFANIQNPRTRKAYQLDIKDFMTFAGIAKPEKFRIVARAHVIAWRKTLEQRELSPATIRRKLSALSALFNHLCECNAVLFNPTRGVKRPFADANEGKTPAIGDSHARTLLEAPSAETLKGKRDRAILSTFLFHGLRCEELCSLKVKDIHPRRGVLHLRIHGKGGKLRYVPAHPGTLERVNVYLEAAGHGQDLDGPLFRPVKNNVTGELQKPLSPSAIYHAVVKHYAAQAGVDVPGFCTHALRATAATTPWITRRILPRCRSGWGTRTSPPPGFTTAVKPAPKTAQRSRWRINFASWGKVNRPCGKRSPALWRPSGRARRCARKFIPGRKIAINRVSRVLGGKIDALKCPKMGFSGEGKGKTAAVLGLRYLMEISRTNAGVMVLPPKKAVGR